ncbi:MAG: nucleotidyl transferase AbiEii/AbiGii toxin family protein [Sporichthyaceae bacterium]|nr:nucleotidyl transferase AbiEii/AbiGii toxin family protein [Sporichthyaceae bacterium]
MSLDPLQEQLARLALSLPEAGQAALAGGGAMLAHNFVDRPTRDIDLFSPRSEDVQQLAEAFSAAVLRRGDTAEVARRETTFVRMIVTVPDGRAVTVEIAQDARIREPVQLAVGRVLHPDEVAADKVLALFGRAAARDLVDVTALLRRYSRAELLALAAEKDQGFSTRVFADALGAATQHPDTAFAELGMDDAAIQSLRASAQKWKADLAAERSSGDRAHPHTTSGRSPTTQLPADQPRWRSPGDKRCGPSRGTEPPSLSS